MPLNILKSYRERKIKEAWKLFHDGKREEAFRKIRLPLKSTNREVQLEALQIAGMAMYKQKKFDQAINYFQKACKLGNARHDWFNLAMAYAKSKHVLEAEAAFNMINGASTKHNYQYAISQPQMLYQYFRVLRDSAFMREAFGRINELKAMYCALYKSEEDYLASRGMPGLSLMMREALPVLQSLAVERDMVSWLEDFGKRIKAPGSQVLKEYVTLLDV
ncbi:M48 family metallopeptidase [Prolixibacter sp. SD074]|uniref:tetratricopeptide repeat protein n=1 Tax=Prolixibacter sp. SD074 TaxID=2652391 RepID=UPI00188E8FF2|nr:tetratricopeptide repeat protein [Prolixibacter sp. SD074]